MKYKYIAKSKDGQVSKGSLEASSKDKALSMVSSMGMYVLSVEEEKGTGFKLPGRVNNAC